MKDFYLTAWANILNNVYDKGALLDPNIQISVGGVSLLVKGAFISGQMIGHGEFLARTRTAYEQGREDPDEPAPLEVLFGYSRTDVENSDSTESTIENAPTETESTEKADEDANYLHLKDVLIQIGGQRLDFPFFRVAIDSIDAWFPGTASW